MVIDNIDILIGILLIYLMPIILLIVLLVMLLMDEILYRKTILRHVPSCSENGKDE